MAFGVLDAVEQSPHSAKTKEIKVADFNLDWHRDQ